MVFSLPPWSPDIETNPARSVSGASNLRSQDTGHGQARRLYELQASVLCSVARDGP